MAIAFNGEHLFTIHEETGNNAGWRAVPSHHMGQGIPSQGA
jgi:hypothetical protein